MTEINVLRSQEYTTNLQLLSQQMGSKFAEHCLVESVTGAKSKRVLSQLDATSAVVVTTAATPAMNIDMVHDGRWVYHKKLAHGKTVDPLDTVQSLIAPQGAYVMNQVAALRRAADDLFLSAFFGTSQTGETGSTSTVFDTNNQVSVSEGAAAATGLNVAKLEAAMELLLAGDIDLDFETPFIGISPKQHRDLKEASVVTSGDFSRKFIFDGDGKITHFNGFNIVISNRLPVDGSSYRRCPVWVRSGMIKGVWSDINGEVRKRPDLQSNPDYCEASMEINFVRSEEAKCVEIKCSEA